MDITHESSIINMFKWNSIRITQFLQQTVGIRSSTSEFFRFLSRGNSSNFVYFYIYPFASLLHPFIGFQLLFALILSEWISLTLKIVIPDERPYWWFPTTPYSVNGVKETLIFEFPETCESTSGFPSLNSLLLSASTYILHHHAKNIILSSVKYNTVEEKNAIEVSSRKKTECLLVTFTIFMNFLPMAGRIFVGSEFYYQSLFGCLIGVFVGKFAVERTAQIFCRSHKKAYCILLGIFISTIIFHLVGFLSSHWDPFWTIPFVLKWCWNTTRALTHLKHNFTFYNVRLLGHATGFLFINVLKSYKMAPNCGWVEKIGTGLLSFIQIKVFEIIEAYFEKSFIIDYLILTFILSFGHVIFTTAVLPKIIQKLHDFLIKICF